MLSRSQVREHSGSYQTVAPTAPQGLLSLKAMFEEEDSARPNLANLNAIFANDFRDVENGTERSKGKSDVVNQIASRRNRYSKYQTDIAQAWCINNSNKTQTVLFEGIRFIILKNDTEWVRIPLSGRLEVRPITRAGKATGEVVFRKMTLDLSSFWKRSNEIQASNPRGSIIPPQYQVGAPPSPPANVHELVGNPSPDPPKALADQRAGIRPGEARKKNPYVAPHHHQVPVVMPSDPRGPSIQQRGPEYVHHDPPTRTHDVLPPMRPLHEEAPYAGPTVPYAKQPYVSFKDTRTSHTTQLPMRPHHEETATAQQPINQVSYVPREREYDHYE